MADLLSSLKNLPNSSGVYQYFDKNRQLLYIGKAKNLKNASKAIFPSVIMKSRPIIVQAYASK